jgi:hypothetical protein
MIFTALLIILKMEPIPLETTSKMHFTRLRRASVQWLRCPAKLDNASIFIFKGVPDSVYTGCHKYVPFEPSF